MKDFWQKDQRQPKKKRRNDWVEIKDADRSCKAATPCGKCKKVCFTSVANLPTCQWYTRCLLRTFPCEQLLCSWEKIHELLDEHFPKMKSLCLPAPIRLLLVLPDTRRTKGCDRSPVLVPPISRLLQHQINKLGPLRLPKYPVVVAVVPALNLVNVRGKEAV